VGVVLFMEKEFDIYGIGSALMDILLNVNDEVLKNLTLNKGEMKLVDRDQCDIIEKEISKHDSKRVPGGSTANAIVVAQQLGCKNIFCDVIGEDVNGKMYREAMEQQGVITNLAISDNLTGHAITFITPDHQRSFAVHLGAALDLGRKHINVEDIRKCKILHTEGYLIGEPGGLRDAALFALDVAKKDGVLVSLDLSDPNIVRNNLSDLREIVSKYVDILFANEDEAREFTGLDEKAALEKMSKMCKVAVVKLGEKGSLVSFEGKVHKIDAFSAKVVDTTGAGDTYAAAVLYGLAKNIAIEKAAKLGSFLAAKVVSQIGARLDNIVLDEVEEVLV
jgi:sugar/nucleoside kinase (ribokinase family)